MRQTRFGTNLQVFNSVTKRRTNKELYKKAYERGVKIIGATAHYVTNDLDEGPIIAQNIVRVDHSYSWQEMRRDGRNVEKVVLSTALQLLLEDRVFVHQNKTVIL